MADIKPSIEDLKTDWQIEYTDWRVSVSKTMAKTKAEALKLAANAYQEWLDEQKGNEKK